MPISPLTPPVAVAVVGSKISFVPGALGIDVNPLALHAVVFPPGTDAQPAAAGRGGERNGRN